MPEKMKPCCARRQTQLTQRRDDLAKAARAAAMRSQRGLDITRNRLDIAELKVEIEVLKQAQVDHDADHAAEHSQRLNSGLRYLSETTALGRASA